MTVAERVEMNRKSAKQYGWAVALFGVSRFDERLVEAVEIFQRVHFLPVTGVVDWRTWRALHGLARGLEDKEARRERAENLKELGSVSRYPEGDKRVLRTERVRGSGFFASSPFDLRSGDDRLLSGLPFLPFEPASSFSVNRRARDLVAVYDLGLGPLYSQGTIVGGAARAHGWAAAVLRISEEDWEREVRNEGKGLDLFARGFRETGGQGALGIMASPCGPFRGGKRPSLKAWRKVEGFDLAFPVLPGPGPRTPPEWLIGQVVAEWSIYGGIRPSFVFPLICPEEYTTPNDIHRFRAWVRDRGIRGIGYAGPSGGPLFEAFCEPLPDKLERVDYY